MTLGLTGGQRISTMSSRLDTILDCVGRTDRHVRQQIRPCNVNVGSKTVNVTVVTQQQQQPEVTSSRERRL